MQTPGDAPLSAAVSAATRQVVGTVAADWDKTGLYDHVLSDLTPYVLSLTVDRSFQDHSQARTGLVDGTAAAQLTVKLSGDQMVRALSPAIDGTPVLPLTVLGCGLRPRMGLQTSTGEQTLPQGVFLLREISRSAGARSATLVALDQAERCRAEVTLPTWVRGGTTPGGWGGSTASGWGVKPQWIIDYAMRRCGMYASPQSHPRAIWHWTGHGSFAPEIGYGGIETIWGGGSAVGYPTWVDGPWGMLAPTSVWFSGAITLWRATEEIPVTVGEGFGWCGWVYCGNGEAGSGQGFDGWLVNITHGPNITTQVKFDVNDRVSAVYIYNTVVRATSLGPTLPTPAQWRYVGVYMQFTTSGWTVTFRANGATTSVSSSFTKGGDRLFANPDINVFGIRSTVATQIWRDNAPPTLGTWPGEDFTPTYTYNIDPGDNEFTYLPDRVGVEAWGLIKEVAAAELGTVGFDEAGAFYFRSRKTLDAGLATVTKVHTTDRIMDYGDTMSLADVSNVLVVKTVAGVQRSNAAPVYELDDYLSFICNPGVTTHDVDLVEDAVLPFTEINQLAFGFWSDAITHAYVACDSGTGLELAPGFVTVRPKQIGPKRLRFTVTNTHIYPVRFTEPSTTTAAFRMGGPTRLMQDPVVTMLTDETSVASYGRRVHSMDKTDWQHLPEVVQPTMATLLRSLATPSPIIQQITTVGDPRVQLGDSVEIYERGADDIGGEATPLRGRVMGYSRIISAEGLRDVLAIQPQGRQGSWVLGTSALGIDTRLG